MFKKLKRTYATLLLRFCERSNRVTARLINFGTVRKMSTVIYIMLKNKELFDEIKMGYVTECKKIQAAVFDVELAEGKSA